MARKKPQEVPGTASAPAAGSAWRRFTAQGALASLAAATIVLVMGWLGWLPMFGFLPPFWGLVAGFAAGIGASLMTGKRG